GGLAEALMVAHRLYDLVADRVVHAECAHRLLEDQADLATAHLADRVALGIERCQRLLLRCAGIEQHLARDDAARPVDQTQDSPRGQALAAATLAHHAELA